MSRVQLLFPQLLLLIVPLLFIFYWRARAWRLGAVVRIAVIVLLCLLAAIPLAPLGGRGVDVVVVVDLSRSMPAGSREKQIEIVRLLEDQRSAGDRVGIVTFGREGRIERLPEALAKTDAFAQQVNADGSDLGGAISLAASLIPRERPGRIIVISDGEANGSPALAAAEEAAARRVTVDFRPLVRSAGADIAVESLELPGMVDQLEPFQFSAWVRSDRAVEAEALLRRDGIVIAKRKQKFESGPTQLTFRDAIDRPGVARYRLEIVTADDRVPENNLGDGAVRVEAPPTILLVNASGAPDNFSRALASGKLAVKTVTPKTMPRNLPDLVAYRGVVLENVPAGQIGPDGLQALTRFATELGGGVLLTGGGASFGVGGYFKSAIDPYLPVSMEIKNEHRKLSLAMVVALDRSGSMAAPVGDGRTKMDLANLGTCAAIETLGPYDEVGVIAIDSSPHIVTPLTSAENTPAICDRVRGIQSMGGGIFVYTALVAAAQMVQQSDKGTRHIVLFADAADAEEEGEYKRLLETVTPLGITVSVIGMGSESDTDAEFLKDVARRGGGRIQFTANVDELPRMFAEEAITVARSSFIPEPTPSHALPDMVLLGDLPGSRFPTLDGYNLSYLRPGATAGVVTDDEYHAPVLAFWHRGLGRIGALTAEVDGRYSGRLNAWKDFGGFAAGVGRWLLGGDPPRGIRAVIERSGGQGIVRVELDPDRKRGVSDTRSATAAVVPPAPGSAPLRLSMAWTGEDTMEARFPIDQAGIYLGAVEVGGEVLPLAPLTLPYSPEFELRDDPNEGRTLLSEIARATGGTERTTWSDAFRVGRLKDRQVRDLVLPLALMLLLLHIAEIAGRRLFLFDAAYARLARMPAAILGWRPQFARSKAAAPAASADGPVQSSGFPAETRPPAIPPPKPAESTLSRAKSRARNRLGQ